MQSQTAASLHGAVGMHAECACQRMHGKPHLKVHQSVPVGKRSGSVGDGADDALHSIACAQAVQGSKGLLRASAQLDNESFTHCSTHQHC